MVLMQTTCIWNLGKKHYFTKGSHLGVEGKKKIHRHLGTFFFRGTTNLTNATALPLDATVLLVLVDLA